MIPLTESHINECLFAGIADDLRADLLHAVRHREFHRLWQDPAFCGLMQSKCIFCGLDTAHQGELMRRLIQRHQRQFVGHHHFVAQLTLTTNMIINVLPVEPSSTCPILFLCPVTGRGDDDHLWSTGSSPSDERRPARAGESRFVAASPK